MTRQTFHLRLLVFWLLFFAVFRLWFVLWFRAEWSTTNPSSVWGAFWQGLPLDLSMAGYLLAPPVLFYFIGVAFGQRSFFFFENLVSGFNLLLISILVFIFGANVFIYEEWHTLLNNRAVEYLSTPRALLDSMSLPFKIACVALYVGGVWLMWRGYGRTVGKKQYSEQTNRLALLWLPVYLGGVALMIRGGMGVMPINESAVYYSPHPFNNHAATNTAWHLAHSQLETRSTVNHYRFMSEKDALDHTGKLLGGGAMDFDATGLTVFQSPPDGIRRNLVFIIMESMTAQVVEELGGEPGICPNLSQLIREGILFEHCYGSGYRTDQGIVSVLAGYPAQPDQSIVLLSDKAAKLNSVPKILHHKGYSTAFLYGGELTFANIGVWLREQQFDQIISEKDFSKAEKTQRWGVDDGLLLQRTLQEINKMQQPFFVSSMTLSLHPPYDVPYQSPWQGRDNRSQFLNSAAFADHAIGQFFKAAQQQPWYPNTLFVLVADHGSASIGDIGQDHPKARHIPLIFFGEALDKTWKGKRVDTYCNHHDIAPSALRIVDNQERSELLKAFPWSHDLWVGGAHRLNGPTGAKAGRPDRDFAYYSNENGLGWVNHLGKGFYSFEGKAWHFWEGQLDSTSQQEAKAYLQVLYDDFLKK